MELMTNQIPQDLREEYPFTQNFFKLKSGHKYHYLDEGDSHKRATLLLHGNPTWSFFYRNVIKKLSQDRRLIVPDHIGCGLSDKPQKYPYTLSCHIENLKELVSKTFKEDETFDLVVHDWGGAIGFGLATSMPERIGKIVILNTAAFTSSFIPRRINLCKTPFFGDKLIRLFNGFAFPATFMAVSKPLPQIVKKGFLYPYNNYSNRIATSRFVQDIPMEESHPSWSTLKSIEDNLDKLTCEKLILWGTKDFCFNDYFYKRWISYYPEAKTFRFDDAGHYLLEDKPEIVNHIKNFLLS